MPTLLHGPRCNLGEWYRVPHSCTLLRGFAIGARVALTRREREMSARALYNSLYTWFVVVAAAVVTFSLWTLIVDVSVCKCLELTL